MNIFKKITAFAAAIAVCLSLAGCHPKNEVALTIGNVDYTSSFYMCALLQADVEAKNKVQEAYKDKNPSASTAGINYYKEKIDGKKYESWVKSRALEICRTYAYLETVCNEKGVKISDEDLESAESYADAYWNYYGYSAYYGANGVSYNTFKEFFTYSRLEQTYFLSIYGKDGTDPLPESDIKNALSEKFVLADCLSVSLLDESGKALSDEEKTKEKTELENFKTRLDKGESFKTIYEEKNGKQENDDSDNDKDKPKDSLAQIFGNEDTESYASDYYKDIAELKLGETKIIEDEDDSRLLLVLKKDIMDDPYYLDNMYDYIINLLKYDSFEDELKTNSGELKFKENKFATNRFKVKKLKSGA